jgi:hypothetical protein
VIVGSASDRRLKIVVYAVALVGYLAVGYWLQVRHGFILGDALSRVSAAQSVLFSREPHLAAIGFIFTPLTAMVQLPWIVMSPLWPAMTERAFSGTIMSSIFMAGAVIQILGVGTDRGLPRWYPLSIATLFALNPMIIFYGSNGMSEAPFIFFLAWAVRRLAMWMIDDDVHHLVAAGQAFAQFSSQYGNTAILAQSGNIEAGVTGGLTFALICIALLAPTLVPVLAWTAVARWRWRNWSPLVVPVALYGAALGFRR